MLCRLEVSNYALIENVDLTFEKGFTVITGETGAGKSILLKALNLLLGERSDSGVLKQSENKCFLEATFDLSKLKLDAFFHTHELDYDAQCIIRREFTSAGKSRCFINDSPVQLQTLKELGEKLISVHSQHETLSLFDTGFQFDVLDYFAGIQNGIADYRKKYKTYRELLNQLEILKDTDARNRKERDYKSFLLNELIEAKLEKIDLEKIQSQFLRIQNSEKISAALQNAISILDLEEKNPVALLRNLVHLLDELKEMDPAFSDLHTRVKSVQIELADIDNELRSKTETLDFSQEDSQLIKDKIDLYNSLSYKHNVQSIQALVDIQQKLEHELTEIESVENAVIQTEKEISKLHSELVNEASKISTKRKIESAALEKTIRAILINLSMPDAELQIELSEQKEIGPHGLDGIDYLFKTNRGGQFLPLKKIASGGELSRLMLAILSTLSETKNLPALVFDEIDTGVSGEVASKMATEFVRMGKNIQIVVITHLPQVAARGNVHLHVAKEIQGNKTVTLVKKLSKKDRITELAKMISGEKVTDAARANAENLLNIS